jgi:protease-4
MEHLCLARRAAGAIRFSIIAALLAVGCDCDLVPGGGQSAEGPAGPHAVLIELDGPLPAFSGGGLLFGAMLQSQHRIEELLDRAGRDPNVQELVFHIGNPEIGMARAHELSDAIARVAATGRPVTCHLEAPGNLGYWLAARSCPRLVIAPAGGVDLVGFALEAVFARELLDSLGVSAEMLHVGRYKDAADSLTRTDMTEESRQAAGSLLGELHRELVTGIAAGRKLAPERIEELVAGGPYSAAGAKRAGLVDGIETLGRVLEPLRDRYAGGVVDDYGREPPKPLSLSELFNLFGGKPPAEQDQAPRIALVPVVGPIVSGGVQDELLAGMELVRDAELVDALGEAARDQSIKAVVLRIDSPGGSALAADNIWAAVRDLAAIKPVVASMGDTAASGGYYVAAAATEVFAAPSTITGSIGVVGGKLAIGEGLAKIGVRSEILARTDRARLFSPFAPFDDAEREAVLGLMRSAYDLFVDRVAEGRDMEREQVLAAAEGRVWSGAQALEAGLVTRLGTLADAVERARELGGLPAGPVEIFPPQKTMMEVLGELLAGSESGVLVTARRHPAGRHALLVAALLLERRVLAVAPFALEVR